MDKPYQGQDPSQARVVFLGRDANYPKDIETRLNCFELVRLYHGDGVGFWENKYGNNPGKKHHPFMICMRSGEAGYKYHHVFSDLSLDSGYAKHISFVELLDVPTTGDSRHDPDGAFDMLLKQSNQHHAWLLERLLGDRRKAVFVPNSALVRMKKITARSEVYGAIHDRNRPIENECPVLLYQYKNLDFYKCFHFSDSRGGSQLKTMKSLIDKYVTA